MQIILKGVTPLEKEVINSVIERNTNVIYREQNRIQKLEEGIMLIRKSIINSNVNGTCCGTCGWAFDPKSMMYCSKCDILICIKCFHGVSESEKSKICRWCYNLMEFKKVYQWHHQFKNVSLRRLYFVDDNLVSINENSEKDKITEKEIFEKWAEKHLKNTEKEKKEETVEVTEEENTQIPKTSNYITGEVLLLVDYNEFTEMLKIYIYGMREPPEHKMKNWSAAVLLLPDFNNSQKIKFKLKDDKIDKLIEYHVAEHQISSLSIFIQFKAKLPWRTSVMYSTEVHIAMVEFDSKIWHSLLKITRRRSQYALRMRILVSIENGMLTLTAKSLVGLKDSKLTRYKIVLIVNGILMEGHKYLFGRRWLIFDEKFKFGNYSTYDNFKVHIVRMKGGDSILAIDEVEMEKPPRSHQVIINGGPFRSLKDVLHQTQTAEIILYLNPITK